MKLVSTAALATALTGIASFAAADCGIASGSVRILSNVFPALMAVAGGAAACATDSVDVTKNQTTEHKDIQVA
ncbi:MAG: sugar ABC transporter substrate-binding protein, partial [Pseudomonadota bacterium]